MFPFWFLSFKRLLELCSAFGIYWWYIYLMLENTSWNENLSICFLLGFWNASNRFWWFTSITSVIIRLHDIVGSDVCFHPLVLVMTGFCVRLAKLERLSPQNYIWLLVFQEPFSTWQVWETPRSLLLWTKMQMLPYFRWWLNLFMLSFSSQLSRLF